MLQRLYPIFLALVRAFFHYFDPWLCRAFCACLCPALVWLNVSYFCFLLLCVWFALVELLDKRACDYAIVSFVDFLLFLWASEINERFDNL